MAIAGVTALGTWADGTSTISSFSSGSITPSAGDLIFVLASSTNNTVSSPTITTTLANSTCTLLTTKVDTSGGGCAVAIGMVQVGPSPGTGTITMNWGASSARHQIMLVLVGAGYSPALVGSKFASNNTSGSTLTVTPGTAPLITSLFIGVCASRGSVTPTIANTNGATNLGNGGTGTAPELDMCGSYFLGSTASAMSWSVGGDAGSAAAVAELPIPLNLVPYFMGGGVDTTSGTSITSPTIYPQPGGLIIAGGFTRNVATSSPALSSSGFSSTAWTTFPAVVNGGTHSTVVGYSFALDRVPGTVTINFGATEIAHTIHVMQIFGVDTTTPFRQDSGTTGNANLAVTTMSINLPGAPLASSLVLGIIGQFESTAHDITPTTGTELDERQTAGANTAGSEVQYQAGSVGSTMSWGGLNASRTAGLVMEIAASAAVLRHNGYFAMF